jgi:hypothetical protein
MEKDKYVGKGMGNGREVVQGGKKGGKEKNR